MVSLWILCAWCSVFGSFVLFCKQKTAYEMRISDWSSDVCSSDLVRAEYVEEVSDKQLIEAAINGMLTSLDPHLSYLNEETFSDMQVQTRGAFGGLGIEDRKSTRLNSSH